MWFNTLAITWPNSRLQRKWSIVNMALGTFSHHFFTCKWAQYAGVLVTGEPLNYSSLLNPFVSYRKNEVFLIGILHLLHNLQIWPISYGVNSMMPFRPKVMQHSSLFGKRPKGFKWDRVFFPGKPFQPNVIQLGSIE